MYDISAMVDPATNYPVEPMAINDHHEVMVYGYVGSGSGLVLLDLPALP